MWGTSCYNELVDGIMSSSQNSNKFKCKGSIQSKKLNVKLFCAIFGLNLVNLCCGNDFTNQTNFKLNYIKGRCFYCTANLRLSGTYSQRYWEFMTRLKKGASYWKANLKFGNYWSNVIWIFQQIFSPFLVYEQHKFLLHLNFLQTQILSNRKWNPQDVIFKSMKCFFFSILMLRNKF